LKFNRIIYLFLILLFIVAAAVATAVIYAVDDNALVAPAKSLAAEQTAQIQQILKANNPASVISTKNKKLFLSMEQSNHILLYGSQKYLPALNARSVFDKDRVYLKMTYRLPENPLGRYFNASLLIKIEYGKYLVLEKLSFGSLSVPRFLLDLATPYMLQQLNKYYASYTALWDHIKRIDVTSADLTLHYQLDKSDLTGLKKMATEVLINDELSERILAYHGEMNRLLNQLGNREQSVIKLLSPLFRFAAIRSRQNSQPVAENQIALLTLAAYVVNRNPTRYISTDAHNDLKKITLTLKGRKDLAQHFLVSSAINALSNAAWSQAIGLQKELKDSDGGSGFSFVDLMADISGNKLADMALHEKTASLMQKRLLVIASENEIIGDISYLPEGLTETEFRTEYGSIGSEEYTRLVREIERRLLLCSLYQR